jgi:GTP-binding protein
LYNKKLEDRPQIVAANKMDIPGAEENLAEFRKKVGEEVPIFPISAATQQGVRELMYRIADMLEKIPATPLVEEVADEATTVLYKAEQEEEPFTIRRENEIFVVEGEKLEKLVKMTNLNSHDSIQRFARMMRNMGVDDALRKKGAENGDIVRIGKFEFEFVE